MGTAAHTMDVARGSAPQGRSWGPERVLSQHERWSRAPRGIGSLCLSRWHLLLSYVLFGGIDDSGWELVPMVELRAPEADPQNRRAVLKRRSGGRDAGPWLGYSDTTDTMAVWIYAVHLASLATESTEPLSILAEDWTPAPLELAPNTSCEELRAQSELCKDHDS